MLAVITPADPLPGTVVVPTVVEADAAFVDVVVGGVASSITTPVSPAGPVFWGVVMVVVSAVLGIAMLALRRAVPFALVVGWALVAIAVGSARTPAIAHAATAMTTILALALLASIARWRRGPNG